MLVSLGESSLGELPPGTFICTGRRHRGAVLGEGDGYRSLKECRSRECPLIGVIV